MVFTLRALICFEHINLKKFKDIENGFYFSYVLKNQKWLKFVTDTMTEVEETEVLQNNERPIIMFYVQQD